MPGTAQTIVIDRPIAEVFAYMNDVAREHEWQPQLREARQTPPGETIVGSRRHYVSDFLGKRIENTYVVTVYEAGRRVVLETTPDSTVDATSDIRWEESGDGTRVTMSMEGRPTGALRFVPARILEATFEKEVGDTLSRLKAILQKSA